MSREIRDSGIEWLGEIPNDWKLRRLKNIFVERKEKNNPEKTDLILSLGAAYGVIPYSEKEGGGNKAKEDLTDYRLAYPNDIVMNSMNIISGAVGISNYFGCVSPVYYILYSNWNKLDPKFYCYMFQTKAFQRSLLGLGNGILIKESNNGNYNTVRMRIPMEKLGIQLLPLPEFEEQVKISAYLDRQCVLIDNIISKTQASIEEYKKLKQSIITQAVTKGVRGDRELKDSGIEWIGKIPAEWEINKVRYIGSTQNGISKGAASFGIGYPFVSYGDIYKNYELPYCVTGLVETNEDERENYSVKRGDIFFTRTSETIEEVGFSCVCKRDIENATFAGFVIRLRPHHVDDIIITDYAKYYFRGEHIRRYLVKEMNLVTRASLGQTLLKNMSVLIPPMKEQQEIADYLDDKCIEVDKLIRNKELVIKELELYKKSLIYEYVTGKKEVS